MENYIINTLDTPFTLDMYSTFTTESQDDYILESIREENPDATYDDFDWTYDMDAIHTKLASLWIDYITEELDDPIIRPIRVISIHRPTYYNYTTDSANIEIEYDPVALDSFIESHRADYMKYTDPREYNSHYSSDPDTDTTEKISFYLHTTYENKSSDWIMYAFEEMSETMYNAISYEPIKK